MHSYCEGIFLRLVNGRRARPYGIQFAYRGFRVLEQRQLSVNMNAELEGHEG